MIAERYFELRARLGTSLFSMGRLAEEVGLEASRVPLLQSLIGSLKEPFLFVVVGEVNVGKSTFLNALFGEEFSKVGVIPTTEKIYYFRYGDERRNVPLTDTMEEVLCPNEFLKDFHIVDTPGTNSIEDEHQQITERFVPMADLVVFVFSVMNPWGATTWQFLEKVYKTWSKNVVFVLQQCDIREPEEVEAIIDHMNLTAQQRFGRRFDIFPVSAKQAFMAKTTGLDKEKLMATSRYGELEKFITKTVSHSEPRMGKLRNVVQTARIIVNEIKAKIAATADVLEADGQLLGRLDETVNAQRERTRAKVGAAARGVDRHYMQLAVEGGSFLQERMGLGASVKSLFKAPDVPQRLERRIVHYMVEGGRAQAEEGAEIVEDDLRALWRGLAEQMEKQFKTKLRVNTVSGEPEWDARRIGIVGRLENSVRRHVLELDLKSQFERLFVRRRKMLWFWAVMALISGGVAGAMTYLGMTPHNQIAIGACLLMVVVWLVYAQGSIGKMTSRFGKAMEGGRDNIKAHAEGLLVEQVDGYFDEFLAIFRPVRELSREHEARFEPQMKQLDEMEAGFMEVERDVGLESGGLDAANFGPTAKGVAMGGLEGVPVVDFSRTETGEEK